MKAASAHPVPHLELGHLGRVLVALLLALLATVPAIATNTAMAGAWKLNLERSDERQQGRPLVDTDLSVELVGEDVQVTRTYAGGMSFTATYVSDGKPQTIETPLGTQNVRTRWKKDKLSLSYTISRQTPRGPFDLDVIENWEVKEDELVIAYSTRIGERPMIRREVYDRKP